MTAPRMQAVLDGSAMVSYARGHIHVGETMLEVSELIYTTCKTYLFTQGKFLMGLWILMTVAN